MRNRSREELAAFLEAAERDPLRQGDLRALVLELHIGPVRDDRLGEELLSAFDERRLEAIWLPDIHSFDQAASVELPPLGHVRTSRTDGATKLDPASLTLEERFLETLQRVPRHLPSKLAAEFEAIIKIEGLLAGAALALTAWAVSALFGIGAIVAAIMLLIGVATIGFEVLSAASELLEAVSLVRHARKQEDLEAAAEKIAHFVAVVEVSIFMAIVAKLGRAAVSRRLSSTSSPSATRRIPDTKTAAESRLDRATQTAIREATNDPNTRLPPGEKRIATRRARELERTRTRSFAFGVARRGDTSTPKNGSVFYSGVDPMTGLKNRDRAEAATIGRLRMRIDETPAGKALNDLNLYGRFSETSPADANQIWNNASRRFANDASGDVVAYVRGANPDRVFARTELPALVNNTNVTSINGIPREQLLNMSPQQRFLAVTGASP
jgi:hypothetical protein